MRGSRSSFASACCSGLLAALAIGCRHGSVDVNVDGDVNGGGDGRLPAVASPSTSPSTSTIAGDAYVTGEAISSKSIGHTSYVLKLRLEGGAVAVFKPRSKLPLGDHRYRGEIAAYRLATALGLDNVPRAIPRTFAAARLGALQSDFAEKGLPDDDGRIRGALMPWIDGYRVLPLEEKDSRARWEAWLFDASSNIPEDRRALAASVSTMIAFDYVTANWDRWSGGNVAEDSATGRVLFVDNDGAFYEGPDPAALARQRALLARVTRFSRRFVAALRGMDAAKVRGAVGDEAVGVPLVSERVVAGVAARCAAVVGVVDARVGDAGEGGTLAFE